MFKKLAVLTVGVALTGALVVAASPATATTPTYCSDKSDIAILGASSETGFGTTGYPAGGQTFSPTTYGWATRYANSVSGQWGTVVTDYAHNGARVADYQPGGRWPSTVGAVADLATKAPSITVINLGGNEYWAQDDPAGFQTRLGQLVDSVRAASPNGLVLLAIYSELKWAQSVDSGNLPQRYTWSQYASAIYSTAVSHGTPLVDLRQYIPPATSTNQPVPTTWNSDGIHQNDAGNLAEYGMYWGFTSMLWSLCS